MIPIQRDQLVGPNQSGRVAFICINGILTNPGDSEGWTDRAVTWLNLHTAGKAEKFEYACGALTRRVRQSWRADAIARMAGCYVLGGYEVILIGHSNGCDLAARVLAKLWPIKIRSAHLFAAATDGKALAHAVDGSREDGQRPQLGALHLYGSADDEALKLARWSRRFLRVFGLGYGDLGLRVEHFAANNNPIGGAPRIFAHRDDTQAHSSWFERGEPFERTMRAILVNEFGVITANPR